MRFAYVTLAPLDRPSAALFRVSSVARALADAGHSVEIVSVGNPGTGCELNAANSLLGDHVSTNVVRMLPPSSAKAIWERATGSTDLARFLAARGYDRVIGYGAWPAIAGALVRSVPRSRRVLDLVEWYSPDLHGFRRTLNSGLHEASMRIVPQYFDRVLVVSRFLGDYYSDRGVRTALVPPIFPAGAFGSVQTPMDGGVHVVFAGSVGGSKDEVTVGRLLRLRGLRFGGERIVVHLVGPRRSELLGMRGVTPGDLSSVVLHGRVAHSEARAIVSRCHFAVLQRRSLRYSRAGFPSKVVESWMQGVPVVANLVGDLGFHLKDGFNGIVLQGDAEDDLREGLERAVTKFEALGRLEVANWARAAFGTSSFGESVAEFCA